MSLSGGRLTRVTGVSFWCAAIAGSVLFGGQASVAAGGADKVFTIANYPVEATAKDAVAAKEKAHSEGQQAALGALFKRLVPVTAYNQLKRLTGVSAAQLIDGVAVRSESNSNTEYLASLDFSFQADAVRDVLQREGVPYVEEQAPLAVLVPVLSEAGKFRAAGGSWSQVWKGLDLQNSLAPLRLEALPATTAPSVIEASMSGQGVDSGFIQAYKSNYVILAVAEVDQAEKKIDVTIAGADAAGPFKWEHSYRLQDNDVTYTMELAAVVTLGVLEGRWKAAKSDAEGVIGGVPGGAEIQMEAVFASIDEWNEIRGRVLEMEGVDDIRIGQVTAQAASMSVRFPGGAQPLQEALAKQGLSLTGGDGQWQLRALY